MRSTRLLQVLALVATFAAPAVLAQDNPPADPHAWPRQFEANGETYTVYQPQVESWDGVRLSSRAAVSVQAGTADPVFGVIWFTGNTDVDKEARMVTLSNRDIPRASFPTAGDQMTRWLAAIRAHFLQGGTKTFSLDRLEAAVAVTKSSQAASSTALANDPPRVIFSDRPAILALIDGAPSLQPTSVGNLQRVINTRAFLLQDTGSGQFYMAVCNRWLTAPNVAGPWSFTPGAPGGADDLKNAAVTANQADLFDADDKIKEICTSGGAMVVYTSTEPAELIESDGPPQFQAIAGTNLQWMSNTRGDCFVHMGNGLTYVLMSGRWFSAPSRNGPWTYVDGASLPPDFARIPADSPAAEVLAAIPGTPQAQEAVIENDIPQTATITRSEAHLDVDYDGEPRMEVVEGTSMQYVVNTQIPVVYVENRYYACHDGCWFWCGGFRGPWVICESLPAVIYTIPPRCPIHYCTYARIYRCTPEYVYCGYTPGYLGTCVRRDGCVCWGTGWHHRPWIGHSWIGRPATYGFGCAVHSCSGGFGVAIGANVRCGCRPWWGPLSRPHEAFDPHVHAHYDVHINNANIYGGWRGAVVAHHEAFRAEE
ncbi:MAG TPA: hypothetical protein VFF73_10570, partial [Planctomycetota bacterium]|nr:hypothetical protein [Planctomycetota bacterium]